MIISFVLLVIGLVLLVKAANWLVDGASSVALKFKISPMVIGLTVVAFGTSAPELLVSITSAMQGSTGIALGNILGSNIANILLILGVSAILYPLAVQRNTIWKEIPMSFLGAVLILVLGIQSVLDTGNFGLLTFSSTSIIGSITFTNGFILLCFFVIFMYYTFGIAKVDADVDEEIKPRSNMLSTVLILGGLVGLALGSKLFVDSAVSIARDLGVSELLIGLTIVSIGTSLPELVTSAVAASKKQGDIIIGNVIGSNIFNIFLILGITALVKPIPLTGQTLIDIIILFVSTLLLFTLLFVYKKGRIARVEGVIMLAAYISYMIYLVVRG